MSKVHELLRRFCHLSKEDRDWMLARFPEDVRDKLLLKLADLVDDEFQSSTIEAGVNKQLVTIFRWYKVLETVKNDCRKKGNRLPSKLIAFIASEQARNISSGEVVSSNNG